MPNTTKLIPIIALLGLLLIAGLILSSDPPQTINTARAYDDPTATSYPGTGDLSNTPTPTPLPSITPTSGIGATVRPTSTLVPTSVGAATATATLVPTLVPPTARTALPQAPVPPTAIPTTGVVITPTPTMPAQVWCLPDEPLVINGTTTPHSGLLLLFNQRVVGGGTADNLGRYQLVLIIGREARGVYPVEVRDRYTRETLQQFSCQVP